MILERNQDWNGGWIKDQTSMTVQQNMSNYGEKNCYQPQACIIFSYCALIFWFLNLLYCKVVFILLIFIELWSTYGSCFINLTFESSSRIIYSSLSFPGLLFGILWQVGFHLWTFSFQWHMSIFEIFNSIMSHF